MPEVLLGELKGLDDLPPIKRPQSFMTSSKRVLDEIARTYGLYWSVQNGVLEVIPANGALSGVTYITPQSGLIDIPSVTDSGLSLKCLLNSGIRPNRQIYVQSSATDIEGASGLYRVSRVGCTGDNIGGKYICDLDAETLSGGQTAVI